MGTPTRVIVFTSDVTTDDKKSLGQLVRAFAYGVKRDFILTNSAGAGKVAKLGASVIVGSAVARQLGSLTALQWISQGFGALPQEFTKSGAIQVFEYTTVQRALLVAGATVAKFVLVTAAFEGGVLVGSMINQTLSERAQDAIGGTINEIVHEGGWRLLWTHPFGWKL